MNVVPFLWGWNDAEGLGFLESYHHERTFLHFPRYPHPTLAKSVGDGGIVLELRILAAPQMLFSKFEKSTPLLVFGTAPCIFLGVWHRHTQYLIHVILFLLIFLRFFPFDVLSMAEKFTNQLRLNSCHFPKFLGIVTHAKTQLMSPFTLRSKSKKLPNEGQALWASHIMEDYYLHANIILSPLGKAYEMEATRGEWPSGNWQLWIRLHSLMRQSPLSSKSKPWSWKSIERASHHLLKNMIV